MSNIKSVQEDIVNMFKGITLTEKNFSEIKNIIKYEMSENEKALDAE